MRVKRCLLTITIRKHKTHSNFMNEQNTNIQSSPNSSGLCGFDIPSEVKSLLESLYKMSLSPDWSESKAQGLVMWGGELYEKYKNI